MSQFTFEELDGQPDRSFVEVDGKYSVVIIRTDEGLIVDVWPTGWDEPFDSLAVQDNDALVEEDRHCSVCGDYHQSDAVPFACKTGDGV